MKSGRDLSIALHKMTSKLGKVAAEKNSTFRCSHTLSRLNSDSGKGYAVLKNDLEEAFCKDILFSL